MRTRDNALQIRQRLIAGQHLAIIGAGLIGLEIAAAATDAGMNVHLLEATGHVMGRAVSTEMSRFFADAHARRGSNIILGARILRLVGEAGRVTGVELTSGEIIKATTVVIAIGVLPNVELAAEAGLAIDNGVRVDEVLLTSDTSISAIGNCASFPSARYGELLRLESVQNAVDQAACVAARLSGKPVRCAKVPWFWSDQGKLKLQIAGVTRNYDTAVHTGDPCADAFSIYCFRAGRLLGVESVNRPVDHVSARRLLAADGVLPPEIVMATGFDLKRFASSLGSP